MARRRSRSRKSLPLRPMLPLRRGAGSGSRRLPAGSRRALAPVLLAGAGLLLLAAVPAAAQETPSTPPAQPSPQSGAQEQKPARMPLPMDGEGAPTLGEALEPTPAVPDRGPAHTIELYEQTEADRATWESPPAPRWKQEPWRYGTWNLLYSWRELPRSGLPAWARWSLAPFSALLEIVRTPAAAAGGLYGD